MKKPIYCNLDNLIEKIGKERNCIIFDRPIFIRIYTDTFGRAFRFNDESLKIVNVQEPEFAVLINSTEARMVPEERKIWECIVETINKKQVYFSNTPYDQFSGNEEGHIVFEDVLLNQNEISETARDILYLAYEQGRHPGYRSSLLMAIKLAEDGYAGNILFVSRSLPEGDVLPLIRQENYFDNIFLINPKHLKECTLNIDNPLLLTQPELTTNIFLEYYHPGLTVQPARHRSADIFQERRKYSNKRYAVTK